jgi:hypothetical protein
LYLKKEFSLREQLIFWDTKVDETIASYDAKQEEVVDVNEISKGRYYDWESE